MKTLDIKQAPAPFLDYVRSLNEEPVILTLGKKPVAVLLPVRDADLETVSLSFNPQFLAIIERSKRRFYREGGIPAEELHRQLGIPARPNRKPTADNGKPKAKSRKRKAEK